MTPRFWLGTSSRDGPKSALWWNEGSLRWISCESWWRCRSRNRRFASDSTSSQSKCLKSRTTRLCRWRTVLKYFGVVWFWPVVQHSPLRIPPPGNAHTTGRSSSIIHKCAGHWIGGTHLMSTGHDFGSTCNSGDTMETQTNKKKNEWMLELVASLCTTW